MSWKDSQLNKKYLKIDYEKYDLNKPLVFSHKERNIKIDYLCLSYANIGNIEYEYMMKGVDETWQRTTETLKEYPTLQPGTYIFKIRAKNLEDYIISITDE